MSPALYEIAPDAIREGDGVATTISLAGVTVDVGPSDAWALLAMLENVVPRECDACGGSGSKWGGTRVCDACDGVGWSR